MAKAPCARLTKPISPIVTERPTEVMNRNMAYASPSNRMLTASVSKCGTGPTPLKKNAAAFVMRGGVDGVKPPASGPAAADLEHLALVVHGLGGVQHLHAELAVRLADDFHGVFVLHDVAGVSIDADRTARPGRRPPLHRVDALGAVGRLTIDLLDCVEEGVHRVPGRRRHEVRIGVGAVSLVPLLDEH